MKPFKSVSAALVMSAFLLGLSGCQKPEGPAERAGKGIDNALDSAGTQMKKAGENIQDAAKGNE